ncbi:hypothetical protein [Ensifer canadensis]
MSKRDWKNTFRDALYRCPELRAHKTHRGLLDYIIHRSHSTLRMCWVSQREMADVFDCNERNIKKLLVGLQQIGAILPVRFSALPAKEQQAISALSSHRVINNNSNVYFPCRGWADDVLAVDREPRKQAPGQINISKADRKRGSDKANERRRRYPPIDLSPVVSIATNPDHEEYLFLNAVGEKGGHSGAPFGTTKGGHWGTDICIDNNPAAIAAPGNGQAFAAFSNPPSKAEQAESLISSLPVQHGEDLPHGYGVGEASACVPRPQALVRPEGTEYDAAGARANDRRAS